MHSQRCCLFAQDGRCLKDMYIGSYTSHPLSFRQHVIRSFYLEERKKNTRSLNRLVSFRIFSFFSRLCLTRTKKPFRTVVLPLCRLLKLVQDRHSLIFNSILLVQWDN